MRRWVPAVLFALCLVGSSSAQAAYESATGAPTAGGAEIAISRHGRPYARLGPVVLNPAMPGADE